MKRGAGGLADIEFLLQYLQIRHAEVPGVCQTNSWEAIDALYDAGLLEPTRHDLRSAYELIRTVENRLRIQRNRAVLDWPTQSDELARLVGGMRRDPATRPSCRSFRAEVARTLATTRRWFETIVGEADAR